jgi:hypothetical protein
VEQSGDSIFNMTDGVIENIVESLESAGLAGLRGIEHIDHATWMLMFDDHTGVGIECRERGDEPTLVAMLGRAPVDRRFIVYETMLCFNALWRDYEGARITLDEPEGELVFEQYLRSRDWTRAELEMELLKFRDMARQWSSYVMSEPDNSNVAQLPFQITLRA